MESLQSPAGKLSMMSRVTVLQGSANAKLGNANHHDLLEVLMIALAMLILPRIG
jgi:hypothetical protein